MSRPGTAKSPAKPDLTKPKKFVFELVDVFPSRGKVIDGKGKEVADKDIIHQKALWLKNPCPVYDADTKQHRTLRLLNTQNSIWQDEQDKPMPLTAEQVNSAKVEVQFIDGFLMLDAPQDSRMIEFLLKHDDLQEEGKVRLSGRPPKFKLISDVTADSQLDAFELEAEAMQKAMEVKRIEDILPHATFLGINTRNLMTHEPLSLKELKTEYIRAAKKNPGLFLKSFDNPKPKTKFKIQQALDAGHIDLARVKGQAHWKETGALIVALDPMEDPVEFMTNWVLAGGDDAISFSKTLEQLSA